MARVIQDRLGLSLPCTGYEDDSGSHLQFCYTVAGFFFGGGLGLVSVPADKREHENKFNKTHKSAVDVETTELVVKVHAWLGCSTDGIHLELKGQLTAFACL